MVVLIVLFYTHCSLIESAAYLAGVCGSLLVILVILCWFRKLWIMHTPPLTDAEDNKSYEPKNGILKRLYQLSFYLSNGAGIRTFLYLLIIALLVITSMLHVFELQEMEVVLPNNDPKKYYINAWQITQSLILTICANFLFLRIHFIFKMIVGLTICISYSMFIIEDPMQIFKVSFRCFLLMCVYPFTICHSSRATRSIPR